MKMLISLVGFVFLAACASVRDVKGPAMVADFTKGVSEICPLHHQRMTKTAVPALFGNLPSSSRVAALTDYENANKSRFPFGETVYSTIDPSPSGAESNGGESVWMYVCRECVKVGDAWRYEWRYGKKE